MYILLLLRLILLLVCYIGVRSGILIRMSIELPLPEIKAENFK